MKEKKKKKGTTKLPSDLGMSNKKGSTEQFLHQQEGPQER